MCLTLYFRTEKERTKGKKPLIAEEDIIVYKSLEFTTEKNVFLSPYYSMFWQRGYHYYQKSLGIGDPKFGLNIGLTDMTISINQGLHSAKNAYYAKIYGCGQKEFKMIIPKGSRYYTDGKCFVSDNLIFPWEN